MAALGGVLGAGRLPSGKTTLFTATDRTRVLWASFHNTSGISQTLLVYVKPFAQSLIIGRAVLAANERFFAVCDGASFWLEKGDSIEGETTSAGVVDYFLSGEIGT